METVYDRIQAELDWRRKAVNTLDSEINTFEMLSNMADPEPWIVTIDVNPLCDDFSCGKCDLCLDKAEADDWQRHKEECRSKRATS